MNGKITRGLALAALTGGLVILGATAANASTLDNPDVLGGGGLLGIGNDGGLLNTGILSGTDAGGDGSGDLLDGLGLDVDLPVDVSGLDVGVLDTTGGGILNGGSNGGLLEGGVLGDGILASTGTTTLLPALGLGSAESATFVGIPVDISNTWASILGNTENGDPTGVAVVPNVLAEPFAVTDNDVLDAVVDIPVSVTCSSVTVLSDFAGECGDTGGTTTPGIGDGITAGLPIDVNGLDIGVLDDGLDTGGILGDGITADLGDTVTDIGVHLPVGDTQDVVADAPINLSDVWVSILGNPENGDPSGIVIVPDLTADVSAVTDGALDGVIDVPVSIECVSITVLSDYQSDCDSTGPVDPTDPTDPTTPTDPTDPTTPTDPTDPTNPTVPTVPAPPTTPTTPNDGMPVDPCDVDPTASVQSGSNDLGLAAAAGLFGALAAMGGLFIGRRFSKQV